MEENNVTNTNNELENKNTVIAFLIVLVIALIGAVVYFAVIKKDDKPADNKGENNQQASNNTPTPSSDDTSNLKPWMKYILEQNISKIEVSKVPCSEDNFETKTVVISTDQLKNTFKKFMNYKLEVAYAGGGGWECGESLKINYTKNGKEYELEYLGSEGHIAPSSDGCANIYDKDLENALYNSADIKDEESKNEEGICVMYAIITDNYLLDEYFK